MSDLPVLGFRFWRLVDGELRGWVYPQAKWELGGVTKAVHLPGIYADWPDPYVRQDHQSPGPAPDTCGLYSFMSLWGAEHFIQHYKKPYGDVRTVCGAVIGGGNICRHGDEGWRAAQAQIVALGYPDPRPAPELKALCNLHGLPLIHMSKLERFAGEWGERL